MNSRYIGALGAIVFIVATSAHAASPYTTFSVLRGTSSGSRSLDEEIASDVKLAFADKGWIDVAPQDAQVIVVTHAVTNEKRSIEAFYEGWGGWDWQEPATAPHHRPGDYKPSGLVVDCFDASTHRLFWRAFAPRELSSGAARATFNTERRVDRLAHAVPASATQTGETLAAAPSTADDHIDITFARTPVAVVSIDGEPAYAPIADTEFQRIVNTPAFIVRDEAGVHYLLLSTGWMEADTLMGPWASADVVPLDVEWAQIESADANGQLFPDVIYDARSNETANAAPAVLISTRPITLVVTDGDPQFAPVGDTALSYATNASVPLFKEPTDQELYVRIADAWYRAWTTDGPWQRVPATALPADLSRLTDPDSTRTRK